MPREKLIKKGVESLTISELLAVILNTGYKGEHVIELASRLINDYGAEALSSASAVKNVMKTFKIPLVKACQLLAVFEIGRRLFAYVNLDPPFLNTPSDVFRYLSHLGSVKKEEFLGLYLNIKNRLIHQEVIAIGSLEVAIIHPREVFAPALEYRASKIIVCHTHPSGDPTPSDDDINITYRLIKASKLIGIPVVDHIIIAKDSYISLKERLKI